MVFDKESNLWAELVSFFQFYSNFVNLFDTLISGFKKQFTFILSKPFNLVSWKHLLLHFISYIILD